jgi:bisphosphoglycerate-independent phosphoglycerate mutase (AlkP superfamily)
LQMKFTRTTGTVADVAPTMLTYMGLDIPSDMKGVSMI